MLKKSESATIDTDAISSHDLTEFFDLLIDNTANNAYRYSIDFTCVPRECGDCGDFMNWKYHKLIPWWKWVKGIWQMEQHILSILLTTSQTLHCNQNEIDS